MSTEFQLFIKTKILKKLLALSLSDVVFIMLINVKMPTIVGILTLMSRINFVLSCITSGLDMYFETTVKVKILKFWLDGQ